jgi:PAS domain S-box-containing protein
MFVAELNQRSRSDDLFRLLVEGVHEYAIFMLDPEGRVASWNAGAARIKGYTREEIVGQHFSSFYTPEDRRAGKPGHELDLARATGFARDEGWRLRKDGTRFWANVTITALYDESRSIIGFAKVTHDESQRRHIEELEEASRRMETFLALLAHELRNPLAPIRNAATIMQVKQIDDPDLAWSRDVIERQVRHLSRLVDDLLDISRIMTGKILLVREPTSIAAVLQQAVEASQPVLDARHHDLVVVVPEEPMPLHADSVRLTQVVVNLLNNAARYTPEGGHVRLSAWREGGDAVIRVRDSGIGIEAEFLPRVFDLFRQGDDPRGRAEGGLGIGLTLVKSLAELHGGSVDAESEGEGRGSTFTVHLPLGLNTLKAHAIP